MRINRLIAAAGAVALTVTSTAALAGGSSPLDARAVNQVAAPAPEGVGGSELKGNDHVLLYILGFFVAGFTLYEIFKHHPGFPASPGGHH